MGRALGRLRNGQFERPNGGSFGEQVRGECGALCVGQQLFPRGPSAKGKRGKAGGRRLVREHRARGGKAAGGRRIWVGRRDSGRLVGGAPVAELHCL